MTTRVNSDRGVEPRAPAYSDTPSLESLRPSHFDDLVRVGRDHDGGYILPRSAIVASDVLLSLGVNDDWSFEESVVSVNPRITVTCVDGSTGLRHILRKTAQKSVDMLGYLATLQISKFLRNARYLSRPVEFRRFFARHELLKLMVSAGPASGCVTLHDLLTRAAGGSRDRRILLKCDIEGSEYEVLPTLDEFASQVVAIVAEFHGLDRHWRQFAACMQALESHFCVAHVHGNNFDGCVSGTLVPVTLEVTLVNRLLLVEDPVRSRRSYPVQGLDMPNNRKRPDLPLAFDEPP